MIKMKRRIILLLTLLIVISIPLQPFASNQAINDEKLEEVLKEMELKREEDLKSIWEQLVEQEKTHHYEAHVKAYDNQYDKKVSAMKNYEYKLDVKGEIIPMEDSWLYWPNGGVIHYKPTSSSYYLEIMEYYPHDAVRDIYWTWSMGDIFSLEDFVDYVLQEIFSSLLPDKLGYTALGYNMYLDITKKLDMNKFYIADRDGDGIQIHHYRGPFSDDEPSSVIWVWDDNPYVVSPNPDFYDYIRYYKQ